MAGRRTGSAAECVRGPSFRHPGLGLGLGLGTDKESKHYNSLIRSDQIRSDQIGGSGNTWPSLLEQVRNHHKKPVAVPLTIVCYWGD